MGNRGLDSWADGISARERVRDIATTLAQPRSMEWIQNQANASQQTAKDELELLVEFEHVHAIETDDEITKYAPNYQRRYFDELLELINTQTRDELREELETTQAAINEWQSEFDVASPADLESTPDDLTSNDIQERATTLREWKRHEANKRLLEHALTLYDDARELDYPGQNDSSNSSL